MLLFPILAPLQGSQSNLPAPKFSRDTPQAYALPYPDRMPYLCFRSQAHQSSSLLFQGYLDTLQARLASHLRVSPVQLKLMCLDLF